MNRRLRALTDAVARRFPGHRTASSPRNTAPLYALQTSPQIPDLPVSDPIDILLPIFNGLSFLPALFKSIRQHTTIPYRIIAIEDASTEEGIRPYLKQILKEHPGSLLLEHNRNLGFPASVNEGVRYTRNHFVILNTDTELPEHWLQRLMYPIFAWERVASTTPFTNAGTICGFPHMPENNLPGSLPEMNLEDVDSAFRRVDPDRARVELPTGVAFCMGMNRDAVLKVGIFDEQAFGRGYCEENDWCLRASAAGFRHILVPNLYVHHAGGGSFSAAETKTQLGSNLKILRRRYPGYDPLVREFLANDPPGPLRGVLAALLCCRAATGPPVLWVDHDLGGGAAVAHQEALSRMLKSNEAVFQLTYDRQSQTFPIHFRWSSYRASWSLQKFRDILDWAQNFRFREILVRSLVSFPDPSDTLTLLRELRDRCGAVLNLEAHDYYPVCPNYSLLNDRGVYCGVPDEPGVCISCMRNNKTPSIRFLDSVLPREERMDPTAWRQQWREFLTGTGRIAVASESASLIFQKAFPDLPKDRFALTPLRTGEHLRPPAPHLHETFHIGILGNIQFHKGAGFVRKFVRTIERSGIPGVKVVVIGSLQEKVGNRHCLITGPYKRNQITELTEQHEIDVFLVPSIFPETFCIVAEELMQMKLPLAVFNLGAQAERVRNYERGIVLDTMEPEKVLERLLECRHWGSSRL